MAHTCIECDSPCYCHGDLDDIIVSHTPDGCKTCGCRDNDLEWDDEDDEDDRCWDCGGVDGAHREGCPEDDSPYGNLMRDGFD